MSDGKTDKFTWNKGDTESEFEPEEGAEPLVKPGQEDAMKAWMDELKRQSDAESDGKTP